MLVMVSVLDCLSPVAITPGVPCVRVHRGMTVQRMYKLEATLTDVSYVSLPSLHVPLWLGRG